MPGFYRAPAALLAVLFAVAGCGKFTYSISPHYPESLAAVPFKADRPIARKLKYVFFSGLELDGRVGTPLIATNYAPSAGGSPGFAMPEMLAAGAGGEQSDKYSALAREASAKGDNLGAAIYSGLAVSSLETEVAMNNMVSNVNNTLAIYFGTMDALAGLGRALHEKEGLNLYDWTVTKTGVIGDAAPPGSVLHMSIFKLDYVRRFDADSRMAFVVNATLVDGKGDVVASKQGIDVYTHSGDDTSPPAGFVSFQPFAPPPQQATDDKLFAEFKYMMYGHVFAAAINDAVANIYRQLDARK